jgi:cell division protein FtsB
MNQTSDDSSIEFGVSLSFWLALLTAAGLFAAVSLAPKLAAYLDVRDEHRAGQLRLLALERQQAELERVIDALKHDPQFAAELARLQFDAVRPGEEILPVDPSLSLNPNAISSGLPGISADEDGRLSLRERCFRGAKGDNARIAGPGQSSAWRTSNRLLATSQWLRQTLLICAAALVLFAFGWLPAR